MARGGKMRPTTQIHKFTLTVKRDDLVFGQIPDDFCLKMLPHPLKKRHGFVAFPDFSHQGNLSLNNLAHFGLDGRQILFAERLRRMKIIIKPILDRGTNGHLNIGIQGLDRLRHNVGGVVTQRVQSCGILDTQKTHPRILRNGVGKIVKRIIQGQQNRPLGQAFADGIGQINPRDRGIIGTLGSIGKRQGYGHNMQKKCEKIFLTEDGRRR